MTPESSWDQLLAAKFLLADGATGTNLFSKGLTTGDAPELWNIQHTRKIAELHTDFLKAGVTPGYIRLSVGIEHIDDIITDIDQALQIADKK